MHSSIDSTDASAISYRIRRCALIPKGISLTLEEEAMVINRIGYRPIPPPGAMISNWFTRHAELNKLEVKPCEEGKQETVDARISARRIRAGSEIFSDQCMITVRIQDNSALLQTDPFTSSLPIRLRKNSWNIDIPHMSEIKPLNTLESHS